MADAGRTVQALVDENARLHAALAARSSPASPHEAAAGAEPHHRQRLATAEREAQQWRLEAKALRRELQGLHTALSQSLLDQEALGRDAIEAHEQCQRVVACPSAAEPAPPVAAADTTAPVPAPAPSCAQPSPPLSPSGAPANPNQLGDLVGGTDSPHWLLAETLRAAFQRGLVHDSDAPNTERSRSRQRLAHTAGYFHLRSDAVAMTAAAPSPPLPSLEDTGVTDPVLLARYTVGGPRPVSSPSTAPAATAFAANNHQRMYGLPRGEYSDSETDDEGEARPRADEVKVTSLGNASFRSVRAAVGFSAADIQDSSRGAFRVAQSPGKSEALFVFFGHYVLKSLRDAEAQFLVNELLPAYVPYVEENPHSLLPSFLAMLSVRFRRSQRVVKFVLMGNVFRTSCFVQRVFDIKGSSVGRDGVDPDGEVQRSVGGAVLLKDNDLPERLLICGPHRRALLLAQLRSDTAFLQRLNVIDYSLLVGVRTRVREESATFDDDDGCSYDPAAPQEQDGRCFRAVDGGLVSLPINSGGASREDTYYLGLADVLQPYSRMKKLESLAKSVFFNRHKLSVVPAEEFANRLCLAVDRITV